MKNWILLLIVLVFQTVIADGTAIPAQRPAPFRTGCLDVPRFAPPGHQPGPAVVDAAEVPPALLVKRPPCGYAATAEPSSPWD